jgi:uncharacterized membrane protein required for colicin V production
MNTMFAGREGGFMSITALLLDILIVVVLVIRALHYARKGFVSSLIDLGGTLVAIVAAGFVGTKLAPVIFNSWFRPGLLNRTVEAMNDAGVTTLGELLKKVVAFVPQDFLRKMLGIADTAITGASQQVAERIVDTAIAPMIIPMISIVLFLVVFLVLRLIVAVVAKHAVKMNKLPVLGGANKILGAAMGVLITLLYTFLLMCILWALDAVYGVATEWFGQSIMYKLFYPFKVSNRANYSGNWIGELAFYHKNRVARFVVNIVAVEPGKHALPE